MWLRMPMPVTVRMATAGSSFTSPPSSPESFLSTDEAVLELVPRHGEADVGQAVAADALHDHVDQDVLARRPPRRCVADDAGAIGHVEQRHLGLRLVERDAVDRQVFHPLQPGDDVDGVGLFDRWRLLRRTSRGRSAA